MTRNEIKQRLDELKVELDNLADEMARIEAEEAERAEIKPWRAEKERLFYSLDIDGTVSEFADGYVDEDNRLLAIGNYYRTRKLAEQDAKELALRGRLRQLRDALCEGYQFIPGMKNYCIMYDSMVGKFFVENIDICTAIAEIFFDTEEHAQQACDILNAELTKEE